MFRKTQQIHLVGIGGSGMSGIAEVLLTMGYKVTGSDLQASDTTRRLEELGGRIFVGHQESNVGEAQVVVISSAVSAQNPEVVAAKAKQIPVIPRAEMLAELMRLKFGVAIAGAHGKTTTTSMVANVLAQGGLDPTMVIGGKVNALGSHARLGRGDLLVAEADESDGSFLRLSPTIVAVTNLDREHLDHYGSMERINECFLEFINKVPFYGLAVLCADDDRLRALFPNIVKRYQTYGLSEREGVTPDFFATEISLNQWGGEFRAQYRGRNLGPFRLAVPGRHNVSNALVAIAIGIELDVPVDLIRKALAAYTGVERRFHLRGEANGIMVVDDYGHHPTEIKATLAAAKQGWGRPAAGGAVSAASLYQDARFAGGFCEGVRPIGRVVLDGNLCGRRAADSRGVRSQVGRHCSCGRPSVCDLCGTEGHVGGSGAAPSEIGGSRHHIRGGGYLEDGAWTLGPIDPHRMMQ